MRTTLRAALIGSLLAASAASAQTFSSTFTTTANGGNYAPRNIVAVWVEDSNGTFVKTIGRWAGREKADLRGWTAKAGNADADAVSGATRPNHTGMLTVNWDLKNKQGAVVPDGTYTIRMELADRNTTMASQNRQGSFTFVKSGTAQSQTGLMNAGFTGVSITFAPGAGTGGGSAGGGTATGGGTASAGGTAGTAGGTASAGGTAGTAGGTSGTGGGTSGAGGGTASLGGGAAGGGVDMTKVGCQSSGASLAPIFALAMLIVISRRRWS
ncbi:MAG: DUF2271 domain-containing protein [Archangiaceae bacterium]|nr:DUF2271 domain-containing protein [Archangiaceae bacterium]